MEHLLENLGRVHFLLDTLNNTHIWEPAYYKYPQKIIIPYINSIITLAIIILMIIKMFSYTEEMEDVLADSLKADALISALEEKLEVM